MTRDELLGLYPAHRGKLVATLARMVGQQVRRGASAKMDRFATQHVSGQNEAVPPAGCECR